MPDQAEGAQPHHGAGGGANAEGWTAFRDALARIEAYTSQAGPTQVPFIAFSMDSVD